MDWGLEAEGLSVEAAKRNPTTTLPRVDESKLTYQNDKLTEPGDSYCLILAQIES